MEGFESSQVFKRVPEDEGLPKDDYHRYFTVQYVVKNREALEEYFKVKAPKMRQDGIDRFGSKFSAARRILSKHIL